MSRTLEETYFKAFEKWLEDNPGKTINDAKASEKIVLDNEIIGIGTKLCNLRRGRTLFSEENMKILKEKYGFIQDNKKELENKIYEQKFLLALDKWLEENKEKTINDVIVKQIIFIDNKPIKLGEMILNIRRGKKDISEELRELLEKKYRINYSLKKEIRKDETYFKAFDRWLEENPGKTINDVKHNELINVDGEDIPIGTKLSHIRDGIALFESENMELLQKKYGFVLISKREYLSSQRELFKKRKKLHSGKSNISIIDAVDKWLELNPGKDINEIPIEDTVELNGEIFELGIQIMRFKNRISHPSSIIIKALTEQYGIEIIDRHLENKKKLDAEYVEAIDKWLELNPGKTINDISSIEIIKNDGRNFWIGSKISEIRNGKVDTNDDFSRILVDQYGLNFGDKRDIKRKKLLEALNKWLEENKGKTINDIIATDKVFIDEKEYPIGTRIHAYKSKYKTLRASEQEKKFVEFLMEKYNFSLEYKKEKGKVYDGDEWLRIIDKWLELNPGKTVDDIPKKEIIIIDDDEVTIGSKLSKMRAGKNLLPEAYMKILKEKYGFSQEKRFLTDTVYIKAIDEWIRLNLGKNINDITNSTQISIDGNIINIGYKLSSMRNGKSLLSEENMKLLKEKYGFKTREELDNEKGFIRNIEPLKKEQNNEIIKEKPYEKYLEEFDGDIELAKEKYEKVKEINRMIREERRNKKSEITLDELEKEFNVNLEELEKYLSQIKSDAEKSEVLYIDEKETLRNYCIRNGYNYDVIRNLIKKSKEYNVSFKQIIEEYLKNGQKLPTRYVYDKNETLVKHILLGINVDSNSVIEDMKHSYTIDEAIIRDVFRRNVLDKKDKWLELPYTFLIEEFGPFSGKNNTNVKFKDFKNLLNNEEQMQLLKMYDKCSKILREYQYLELGLEKDRKKRKELIKKYSLTDDEITKSTLKTMEYENGILIAKNDVKSERLKNIRPVIINWNGFNQEAKNKLIKAYKLTKEELEMIERFSKEIQDNLGIYKELLIENNVTNNEVDTIKQYHKNYYYNMNLYK